MNRWILSLVMVLAIAVPSFAQQKQKMKNSGRAEDEVKALDQGLRDSALKGDASFLEKYLADNYVGIYGDGMKATKDEAVRSRKEGKTKYQSIDLRDQKIRVFGNTAIVDDDAMVKGSGPGQSVDGEYRASEVWVKQGNDWKLVSFQVTPVHNSATAEKK